MAWVDEYTQFDAVGLADLISKKEVSPTEVTEAAIAQIDRFNPQLNAVVHTQFADAKRLSKNVSGTGVFSGVPFLLKDLLGEQANQPCTFSCAPLADWRAKETAELVKRFERTGLNILGRTNAPEFGIYGVTESEFRGPCLNPWNLAHTPGGSSGGSAAAVAARMVPVAHAGDGGGSIRIPAAHCGLVGLKPSRGRLPMGPDRGERWGGLVCEGVVSRSVRDSAMMLHHVQGADVGAPYFAPPHPDDFLQLFEKAPKKLRIGLCEMSLLGDGLHPDNLKAVNHTADLLKDLGHEVEYGCPSFERDELRRAYFIMVGAGVSQGILGIEEKLQRRVKYHELEPSTWALKMIADSVSAGEYVHYQGVMHRESRKIIRFFESFDLLLTPTAAIPPVKIGSFKLSSFQKAQIKVLRSLPVRKLLDMALDEMAASALNATPNTMLFNMTGQPAISLPLFWNQDDLPIGTQLVGRPGAELTLLQVARQLEEREPWAERRPTLLGDS